MTVFYSCIVKPVYNDHPRDPEFVAVVDRWPLFRGSFMLCKLKLGLQNAVRCRQVVVSSGLTVYIAKGVRKSFLDR